MKLLEEFSDYTRKASVFRTILYCLIEASRQQFSIINSEKANLIRPARNRRKKNACGFGPWPYGVDNFVQLFLNSINGLMHLPNHLHHHHRLSRIRVYFWVTFQLVLTCVLKTWLHLLKTRTHSMLAARTASFGNQ